MDVVTSAILHNDDCACDLVQAISDHSRDEVWSVKLEEEKINHKQIRIASMDYFYELVTGDPKGFYKICMALPATIEEVINNSPDFNIEEDTVFQVSRITKKKNISFLYALYLLGFGAYKGFTK